LDDLADHLNSNAGAFGRDMIDYFAEDYTPTALNIKRAQKGFEYHKLAMVQNLLMYREAALLKVYANPEYTCELIISLRGLAEKAEAFKVKLQRIWDMLKDERLSYIYRFYDGTVDDFNGRRTWLIRYGGERDITEQFIETQAQVIDAVKEELTYDMEYLSYPKKVQMDFFDRYESKTIEVCNAIKNDPFIRFRFKTDPRP